MRTAAGRRLLERGRAHVSATAVESAWQRTDGASDVVSVIARPAAGSRGALAQRLRDDGLVLKSTVGDGNCLFRAIRDDGDGHAAVRRNTVAYIRAHPRAYAEFFADGEGIDAHLLKVS